MEENEFFNFRKVEQTDTEMMNQIYRLRFDVYCRECGFIKEEDYPNGLEIDEYDKQSVHFVATSVEGDVIATMRMILLGKYPLPIETHCTDITVDHKSVPEVRVAEISRLVISKRLRRRTNDALYYEAQVQDQKVSNGNNEFFRRAKPMAFGLYREVYQESKRRGITHWYTVMEKGLWLLLRTHGFVFECIGQEVDYYGPVRPYLGTITRIEEEVSRKFPKFFGYFLQNLEQEHVARLTHLISKPNA